MESREEGVADEEDDILNFLHIEEITSAPTTTGQQPATATATAATRRSSSPPRAPSRAGAAAAQRPPPPPAEDDDTDDGGAEEDDEGGGTRSAPSRSSTAQGRHGRAAAAGGRSAAPRPSASVSGSSSVAAAEARGTMRRLPSSRSVVKRQQQQASSTMTTTTATATATAMTTRKGSHAAGASRSASAKSARSPAGKSKVMTYWDDDDFLGSAGSDADEGGRDGGRNAADDADDDDTDDDEKEEEEEEEEEDNKRKSARMTTRKVANGTSKAAESRRTGANASKPASAASSATSRTTGKTRGTKAVVSTKAASSSASVRSSSTRPRSPSPSLSSSSTSSSTSSATARKQDRTSPAPQQKVDARKRKREEPASEDEESDDPFDESTPKKKSHPPARRRVIPEEEDDDATESGEENLFELYLPSHNGKGRPIASITSSSSSSSSSPAKLPAPAASSARSSSTGTRSRSPSPSLSSSTSSSTSSSARTSKSATSTRVSSKTGQPASSSKSSASSSTTTTTSRSQAKPASRAPKRAIVEIDLEEEDDRSASTSASSSSSSSSTTKPTSSSSNQWLSPRRAAGKFTKYTRSNSSEDSSSSSSSTGVYKKPHSVALPSSSSSSSKRETKSRKQPERKRVKNEGLWSQKYDPQSEDDLAVYPKRVTDVKNWLKNALAGKGRILCLSGPSGGGKTSLIKVLARQLSVTITEWINPATCPWTDSERKLALPYTAPIQEFKDFLQRTERYPSLIVSGNSGNNEGGKRIVLVEDLPYLGHEPALRTFQELLREHLRAPTARFPLVLIISDDSFGNSPLFRLLPQDVMAHSAFSLIKIAGVPPTRAAKVLAKIAGLEGWTGAGKAARGKATGVNALAKVCAGDLRSAINSLQLLSRSGGQLTDEAADSAQRDVPLSLFHALGKVLHNKRNEDGEPANEVEQVIEQAGLEPARFTEFVHENYPGFMSDDIDAASMALDYLTDADTLQAVWEAREDTSPIAGALWSRGYMYASRNAIAPGSTHGYRPLFKPRLYAATSGQNSNARAIREVGASSGALMSLAARPAVLATEILPVMHRIAILRPTLRPLITAQIPGGFHWLAEFSSYSRPSIAPSQTLREDEIAELPDANVPGEGDAEEAEAPLQVEEEQAESEASDGAANAASLGPKSTQPGREGAVSHLPGAKAVSSGHASGGATPWKNSHIMPAQPRRATSPPPDPVLLEDDITEF